MVRRAERRGVADLRDSCWMRVLSRSAGWRRMEVDRPLRRPATKWKAGGRCAFVRAEIFDYGVTGAKGDKEACKEWWSWQEIRSGVSSHFWLDDFL
jgi:hypothetical protein